MNRVHFRSKKETVRNGMPAPEASIKELWMREKLWEIEIVASPEMEIL